MDFLQKEKRKKENSKHFQFSKLKISNFSLFFCYKNTIKMKFLLLFTFILFTIISFTFTANNLKIYFFKVGQADSQLIVFPSGYSILIDAGEPVHGSKTNTAAGHNGKYISERLYKILGKKKIDVFVLSHFHFDHFGRIGEGGIWYLIEKKGFTFGKFIHRNIGSYNGSKLSGCKKSNIKWNYVGSMSSLVVKFVCYATSTKEKTKLSSIAEIAHRCNTNQIHPPDNNSEVKIIIRDAFGVKDSHTGKVLNRNSMSEKYPVNENDFSICLRITFGQFVYATCGDLSGFDSKIKSTSKSLYHDVETSVAPMIGEVDLMKVSHHGSSSSTNKKWCDTLHPTVAVSSCGDSNAGVAKVGLKSLKRLMQQCIQLVKQIKQKMIHILIV